MARVIEAKRCTLDTMFGNIEGWGVGIEADTYEEALILARNAIRPMVEDDIKASLGGRIFSEEAVDNRAEDEQERAFFQALGL